ncbi:L-2-hydroxyglutarate oxidase LhgO [Nocardioides luteus]|uniref:Hydroxyglutarate oxidase n=1 Tax=Nocardioides luteus TaxID=1844 RepID=A0ABQ5SYI9_9ACTN|nr:L-2-hydroxyglutarate oxidase [Nocardioides luteus]MDR7310970.1 L-2-hydroxyglutarate oxidase LhgO [Nocardioides luteus]GGR39443.1 hydroxyglutarate oxidase [Nocardioides luteus]GLJ69250.1 hydroxyglutarate oxidase [Nocardioides luteus]
MSTYGVVGGGIVGLAVAREILRRGRAETVVVFEKEATLGAHQTGHNSGVVHAGIYYRPGSLKARLCARGRDLLEEFAAEHAIPLERCGKLVVAVDETEMDRFDALEKTATANGVPGLRRVGPEEIKEIEPYAAGLAALHSPRTAITDYVAVTEALGRCIVEAGGEVRLGQEVMGVHHVPGGIEVETATGRTRLDHLVVCGGLESDRLGELTGGPKGPRIIPFRGEYMQVSAAKQDLVRGMVYPVPDPRYPFLGVHFTRRVGGGLEVGPNAFLALSRGRYGRASLTPADLADTLAWPGFWRFAAEHWRTGFTELRGVLSKRAYMRAAQRYVPEIGADDVVRAGLGIRAQAVERDGSLVDDFVIHHTEAVTSVRNAPSPAATSSLAIAEYVVEQMS